MRFETLAGEAAQHGRLKGIGGEADGFKALFLGEQIGIVNILGAVPRLCFVKNMLTWYAQLLCVKAHDDAFVKGAVNSRAGINDILGIAVLVKNIRP